MFIHICGELLGSGWIFIPVTFGRGGVLNPACRDRPEGNIPVVGTHSVTPGVSGPPESPPATHGHHPFVLRPPPLASERRGTDSGLPTPSFGLLAARSRELTTKGLSFSERIERVGASKRSILSIFLNSLRAPREDLYERGTERLYENRWKKGQAKPLNTPQHSRRGRRAMSPCTSTACPCRSGASSR